MARRFTLELIMDLASRIGANPAKAISRSNISFLGKGPTKNPLFQNRLAGLENATEANLGKPETLFAAIDDAVGWAKDGKLNSIQTEILGHNLSGIEKIINPPPLPMASVTAIRPGIEGLRRFPKESHKFFGRPLKDKDLTEIEKLIKEGKLKDARGREWNFLNLGKQSKGPEYNPKFHHPEIGELPPGSRLPGTGAGAYTAMNAKTGMSRAIARQILQQDTRLKLKPEELFMLKEGKGEPLDLMRKYYGNSMVNLDAFLDDAAFRGFTSADEAAATALKEIELIPQFAQGGLARILEV